MRPLDVPSVEEAIDVMLTRMQQEYDAVSLPADSAWRSIKYDKGACRPTGIGGGKPGSPHLFVEKMKQIWLDEGHLHTLQRAWLADFCLDDLSYANNFNLWRTSNGLLDRIARIELPELIEGGLQAGRSDRVAAFTADLRSDTQYFIAVAPISGVSVEGAPVHLSPEVTVRCLSPIEHELLINSAAFRTDPRAEETWWRFPSVVETRLSVRYHRGLETRMEDAAALVRNARLALSLVADKEVYSPGLYGSLETAFPVLINRGQPSPVPSRDANPWPLPLQDADHERIAAVWGGLAGAKHTVGIAMSRLTFILDRDEEMDRLIDAWVALEALFSGSLRGELRYRLSIRIANFLEGAPLDRQETFNALYDSYDVRSRVVHGDKKQPSQDRLSSAAVRTVSIARECACRVLASGDEVQPDGLDEAPFLIV